MNIPYPSGLNYSQLLFEPNKGLIHFSLIIPQLQSNNPYFNPTKINIHFSSVHPSTTIIWIQQRLDSYTLSFVVHWLTDSSLIIV